MKKLFKFFAQSVIAGVVMFALALVITANMPQTALAQVVRAFATPARFDDYTGTNSLTIGSGLKTPISLTWGTNVYTGATSNLLFLRTALATNTLVIQNGIITGIQ